MSALEVDLTGAEVLWPDGTLSSGTLSVADGRITDVAVGRVVNLSGYQVLPGIVDAHGDAFERHLAPRRGAMTDMAAGVLAAEAELAANGITSAVLAQFWSWEGGLRAPAYAARVFEAIAQVRPRVATDLIGQLRFETAMLDDYDHLPQTLKDWGLRYVVFNDHLPHDKLAAGKRPPRLTGQALKAGRNPDHHLEMMMGLHARRAQVPVALDALAARLAEAGVRMGSHDDRNAQARADWHRRGVRIAEFPETPEAAEAARAVADAVVMGAPNVMRGGSHNGNVSAVDMVAMGLCDALASDYHYPSPRRAALMLAQSGVVEFGPAWALISAGPAQVLGLSDRGRLAPGLRADVVVLEPGSGRVVMTMAGGQVSYMSGPVVNRFLA